MKTKFLKKLSFVLAVAMVLSVLYPAAGVFAAAKPKLNATSKYLHLDVDGLNEFDFNISNKQKGWKYEWESANEDVVTVNSKGVVTAEGVGKTKVTVYITDKDGEEVARLSATVTVRDNIREVNISNPPEGALAVGQEYDFNRSFVTRSGSKNKTSSITRWEVEPSENATIDDKGVFKATKAGKYTVTARSFQSEAKYQSWLKDKETYKDYVLDTDSVEVTVAASMVEAKQVDTDTVKVTFDSAVDDIDKNIVLSQLVGGTKVKQLVKEVKVADDKQSADITTYVPFTQEATYVVEFPEMDDVSFVAARKKPEDVAYIKVDTTKAELGKETEIVVKLFNADNVDISDGEGLASRVTLEAEEVDGTYFDGYNTIVIYEKDKSVKVTATYHTYNWDTTTGEEIGNLKAVGIIVGVEEDTTDITGLSAWTIVGSGRTPDFDKVNHVIAAEDNNYFLYVKLNTKKGTATGTVNSKDNPTDFEFESSNEEVLIIGADGRLYPNKQGSVTVVVKYGDNKKPVAAFTITVGPKAKPSNLVLSSYEITLSNKINDSKDVTLKLTDQNGREIEFAQSDIEVSKVSGPDIASVSPYIYETGEKKVTFSGKDQNAGRYSFKITVQDVTRYIVVNVVTANTSEVVKHTLELGSNKIDLKAEDKKTDKSVSVKLFGLASNGTKIKEATIDGNEYKLVIDAPYVSGANWDYTEDNRATGGDNTTVTVEGVVITLFDGTNYTLAKSVSGSYIRKAPVGTYKVTAYQYKDSKWVPVASASFVVEDKQPQPAITKVKTKVYDSVDSTDPVDVKRVVADCFEIKLDGVEMTDIMEVDYSGTDDALYIRSITVRKWFTINDAGDQTYISYKVNVGTNIKKK